MFKKRTIKDKTGLEPLLTASKIIKYSDGLKVRTINKFK
jgi:hypothetical protein